MACFYWRYNTIIFTFQVLNETNKMLHMFYGVIEVILGC